MKSHDYDMSHVMQKEEAYNTRIHSAMTITICLVSLPNIFLENNLEGRLLSILEHH